MSDRTYYHGGFPGLVIGDELEPAPPHVEDGCPVCVARAEGRIYTVGEYRRWLVQFGDLAKPVLASLEGVLDAEPVDPPSKPGCVYLTTDLGYARWYAARSRGDLYRVEPLGEIEPSDEDHFSSFMVPRARIVGIVERGVRLKRRDRRALMRRWAKADRKAGRR